MHPTAELFTEKAWAAIVAAQQLAQQNLWDAAAPSS